MKQIWINKAGPPEVLEVREAPDPQPASGEVRVRVEAAGVNFADILARMGMYQDLPGIPIVVGYEVAGRVDAVGEAGLEGWIGKDVLGITRFGGYSDVVSLPVNQVFERPADMSAEQGAALPVNYLTAYQLVVVMGSLNAGETMLVHSAGGGVGVAAVQMAKHLGATVIGTASAAKHAYLRSIGIDHCIDYRMEDFVRRARELTGGDGVELVLDPLGGSYFRKGYSLLAPTGRLGMYGIAAASTGKQRSLRGLLKMAGGMPWFLFNPARLMNQNRGVFGVNMGRMWGEIPRMRGWMETLLEWYRQRAIQPHVDRSFSFELAADAHHYLQDRKNLGKVLLVP